MQMYTWLVVPDVIPDQSKIGLRLDCFTAGAAEPVFRRLTIRTSTANPEQPYQELKFRNITRSALVATLRRLGVAGLLCESDLWDPDLMLDPLENVVLEEAGEYYIVFGQTSIENQVCPACHLGLLAKTCFATQTEVAMVLGCLCWQHSHRSNYRCNIILDV